MSYLFLVLVAGFITTNIHCFCFGLFTCLRGLSLGFEERCSNSVFNWLRCFNFLRYYYFNIFLFLLVCLWNLFQKFLFNHCLFLMNVAFSFFWRGRSKINLRVISLFHPSMAFITIHISLASTFLNRLYFIGKVPRVTFLRKIFIIQRIPPKILIVMSIGTISAVMSIIIYLLLKCIWTPNSLIFVHLKIGVIAVLVKKCNGQLLFGMSERAEISILTSIKISFKSSAKFAFIANRMIELFDFIVSSWTVGVVTVFDGACYLRICLEILSPLVFVVMKV